MQEAIEKALALGASIAGYVPARLLRDCPSARAEGYRGWDTFTGSVIVLGLYHDPARPEMDWWDNQPEERTAKLRSGLDPEREAEVLKAWHARG